MSLSKRFKKYMEKNGLDIMAALMYLNGNLNVDLYNEMRHANK